MRRKRRSRSARAKARLARCRRAERSVTPLVREGQVPGGVQVFLNRLSDWLFVAARFTAKAHGHPEIVYKKAK